METPGIVESSPTAADSPAAEACLPGPMRSSVIGSVATGRWPRTGGHLDTSGHALITWVGTLSEKNGQILLRAKGLAPQVQENLRAATTVPYIGCALAHATAVRLGTTNGPDNAYNMPDAAAFDNPNTVDIVYSRSSDSRGALFIGNESMIPVLTHELTHNLFDEWVHRSDPETQAALNELKDLYVADITAQANAFRAAHGPAVIKDLQRLKATYLPHDSTRFAELLAIDTIIAAFQHEDLFDAYATSYTDNPQVSRNTIADMVWTAAKELGYQTDDAHFDYKGIVRGLRQADALYVHTLEDAYSTSDESTTLDSTLGNEAGGPYNSLDEWVASTIDSDQCNPQHAVDALPHLPDNRKPLAIQGRHVLMRIFQLADPELLPFMQTPGILQHIS